MIAEPALKRLFPARPDRLCDIRAAVAEATQSVGCSEGEAQDVVLAVDEACQNIIRHAYGGADGDIIIQVARDGDLLVVWLLDFAPPADLSKIHPRPLDDLRPGGLGTHLMREVMDDVSFLSAPAGAGNLLQMVKRITGT